MIDFLKKAFSDNGSPSSSRLMTAASMLVVLTGFLYVCFKTHHLPDGGASTGAAALGTAPYALNQVKNGWGKKDDQHAADHPADHPDDHPHQ